MFRTNSFPYSGGRRVTVNPSHGLPLRGGGTKCRRGVCGKYDSKNDFLLDNDRTLWYNTFRCHKYMRS